MTQRRGQRAECPAADSGETHGAPAVRGAAAEREARTLIYELLDAHDDTLRIASACGLSEDDPVWAVHLDYLRALQRLGRESLAQIG